MSVEVLKVFVRGLILSVEVGVYDHEYGRRQPLIADIELDLAPASCEHIADTVSYAALAAKAQALAETGHFRLVETFAERLARDCLDDPKVLSARVRIEKPEALAPDAAAGGVEIVVGQGDR
ncbi:MAG TPA: dihydroneopterin aldolase [Caulobacteraceae bacterium]|nr:dihydroneopterin aldolase [Caulobacteraceae bacterium]